MSPPSPQSTLLENETNLLPPPPPAPPDPDGKTSSTGEKIFTTLKSITSQAGRIDPNELYKYVFSISQSLNSESGFDFPSFLICRSLLETTQIQNTQAFTSFFEKAAKSAFNRATGEPSQSQEPAANSQSINGEVIDIMGKRPEVYGSELDSYGQEIQQRIPQKAYGSSLPETSSGQMLKELEPQTYPVFMTDPSFTRTSEVSHSKSCCIFFNFY